MFITLNGYLFGNVTAAFVVLLVTYGVLTLLIELGRRYIMFAVASDSEDAPCIKLGNPLVRFWFNIINLRTNEIYKYHDKIIKHEGGWAVLQTGSTYDYYAVHGTMSWCGDEGIAAYCIYKDYTAAEDRARKEYGDDTLEVFDGKVLFMIPLTDLTIFLLQFNFLVTTVILSVLCLTFGTRWISKKLYKNMKKTGNHEERIGKLEDSV